MNLSAMGNFKSAPGASPTAPPIMQFPKIPMIVVDFTDTNPHEFKLEYSHSGDQAGGGLTLKWEAPAKAQLDEALARTRLADVIVAFVGLSPQLEGEEMRIKIPGFSGGDRTSLDLPEPQENFSKPSAPLASPSLWFCKAAAPSRSTGPMSTHRPSSKPGIPASTAATPSPASSPVPITLPAASPSPFMLRSTASRPYRLQLKDRTYRYFPGKPLWGFGYGLSYSKFTFGPVKLSTESLNAADLGKDSTAPALTATITVTNTSEILGDEVVEAYLKTPQSGGPIHSLAGFERVSIPAGESKDVTIAIDPRTLSSVDDQGNHTILPGKYTLTLGDAQPQEAGSKSEAAFTVTGKQDLPK